MNHRICLLIISFLTALIIPATSIAQSQEFPGIVNEVSKNQIIVSNRPSANVAEFTITSKTLIMEDGAKRNLHALKPGMLVNIIYNDSNGHHTAVEINILPNDQ